MRFVVRHYEAGRFSPEEALKKIGHEPRRRSLPRWVAAAASLLCLTVLATVLWLKQHHPGAKVYCQGTRSLVEELASAGIDVTEQAEPVDVVLVGFDTELTTAKLRNTCEILSTQDPVYIAANPDWVCPVSFGFVPDCGSICMMIKNATGKWPAFIGKPEPLMILYVMEQLGYSAEETVVIGDRLYTDIESGLRAGVTSLCVLSGEATVADILASDSKPTLTFQSVAEICEVLKA